MACGSDDAWCTQGFLLQPPPCRTRHVDDGNVNCWLMDGRAAGVIARGGGARQLLHLAAAGWQGFRKQLSDALLWRESRLPLHVGAVLTAMACV